MPIFQGTTVNANFVSLQVIDVLRTHRRALEQLSDLFAWTSTLAVADLTTIGFTAADAQSLLNAVADAHAEYLIHTTGQPPATYPQAASAYVYGTSQNQVLGPQLCLTRISPGNGRNIQQDRNVPGLLLVAGHDRYASVGEEHDAGRTRHQARF